MPFVQTIIAVRSSKVYLYSTFKHCLSWPGTIQKEHFAKIEIKKHTHTLILLLYWFFFFINPFVQHKSFISRCFYFSEREKHTSDFFLYQEKTPMMLCLLQTHYVCLWWEVYSSRDDVLCVYLISPQGTSVDVVVPFMHSDTTCIFWHIPLYLHVLASEKKKKARPSLQMSWHPKGLRGHVTLHLQRSYKAPTFKPHRILETFTSEELCLEPQITSGCMYVLYCPCNGFSPSGRERWQRQNTLPLSSFLYLILL